MPDLDRLDRLLGRAGQRLASVVGRVGLTPYQLGMALAGLPLLPCLALVPSVLLASDACARLSCKGQAAQSAADLAASLPLVAVTPLTGMAACAASAWLCVRRQREWRKVMGSGRLMPAPRLLSDAIWRAFAPVFRPLLCSCLLVLEVFALSCLTMEAGSPASYGSMKGFMDFHMACLALSLATPYAHALAVDYLLLSTPRTGPQRRRAGAGVPGASPQGAG